MIKFNRILVNLAISAMLLSCKARSFNKSGMKSETSFTEQDVEALAKRIGPALTRTALNEVARMKGLESATSKAAAANASLAEARDLLYAVAALQGARFSRDQLAREQGQWVTETQLQKSSSNWGKSSTSFFQVYLFV